MTADNGGVSRLMSAPMTPNVANCRQVFTEFDAHRIRRAGHFGDVGRGDGPADEHLERLVV